VLIDPTVVPPNRVGHTLKYTGTLSREQFNAQCTQQDPWYHSYYFDNGYCVRGEYDIGVDVGDYGFPASMAGMRVLDVGTGGGWFALLFEQLGAEVTTVDVRGYCDFDVYGRPDYPSPSAAGLEPASFDAHGNPIYNSPVSGGFWVMKRILNANARFHNSRIYDISLNMFEGRGFDLIFLGAILCHLRDPIGALMAARRVCIGELIATTPVVLGEPEGEVMPRQYLPYTELDRISWWLPNEGCFRHWFRAAGFRNPDIQQSVTLRCDVEKRSENGRVVNGNQTLRLGRAKV
jgi:SAM-dependent methyltransferase